MKSNMGKAYPIALVAILALASTVVQASHDPASPQEPATALRLTVSRIQVDAGCHIPPYAFHQAVMAAWLKRCRAKAGAPWFTRAVTLGGNTAHYHGAYGDLWVASRSAWDQGHALKLSYTPAGRPVEQAQIQWQGQLVPSAFILADGAPFDARAHKEYLDVVDISTGQKDSSIEPTGFPSVALGTITVTGHRQPSLRPSMME